MPHSRPDSIFHCSERLTEGGRDFSVTHSVEVCHLERSPLLIGKGLKRLLDGISNIRSNKPFRLG